MVVSGLVGTWLEIVCKIPPHVTQEASFQQVQNWNAFWLYLGWVVDATSYFLNVFLKDFHRRWLFIFSCQTGSVLSPWMQNKFLLTCIDESLKQSLRKLLKRFFTVSISQRGKDWNISQVRAFLDTSFASNLASELNECYNLTFQLSIGISTLREYDNHYIETDLLMCWMAYPLISSTEHSGVFKVL